MYLSLIVLGTLLLLSSHSDVIGHPMTISFDDCHGIIAGKWGKCSAAIARQIFLWHKWSDATRDDRCGFPCVSQLKGRLSNFQWKWDARYKCETNAPGIVGVATKLSRKGAVDWAVDDFLQKAVAAGHIQPEDINC